MSVGSSTGLPARSALDSLDRRPSPLHHPLAAGEVEGDRRLGVPAERSSAATACALPSWHSRTSAPPGASTPARVATSSSVWPSLDERRRAAPSRAPPAASASSSSARDVRRVRDDEVERARRAPRAASSRRARPRARAARRSRARARARPARRPSPSRARPGCSCAIASAIAPLPGADVDDARRVDARRASASARSTTISVSGRGTSARASVASVSRRKPHSPRTYASGSRRPRRSSERARRRLLGLASAAGRAGCRARAARGRAPCASRSSASSRGESTPLRARNSAARAQEPRPTRHAEAFSSARRRSSAVSVSVNSSRSPLSTSSSR